MSGWSKILGFLAIRYIISVVICKNSAVPYHRGIYVPCTDDPGITSQSTRIWVETRWSKYIPCKAPMTSSLCFFIGTPAFQSWQPRAATHRQMWDQCRKIQNEEWNTWSFSRNITFIYAIATASAPEIRFDIVNNVQYGNGKLHNHMTIKRKKSPTRRLATSNRAHMKRMRKRWGDNHTLLQLTRYFSVSCGILTYLSWLTRVGRLYTPDSIICRSAGVL